MNNSVAVHIAINTPTMCEVENLAFAHWQYSTNEKAYKAGLITKAMYELARDEVQKSIDSLTALCYNVH